MSHPELPRGITTEDLLKANDPWFNDPYPEMDRTSDCPHCPFQAQINGKPYCLWGKRNRSLEPTTKPRPCRARGSGARIEKVELAQAQRGIFPPRFGL